MSICVVYVLHIALGNAKCDLSEECAGGEEYAGRRGRIRHTNSS